MGDQKVKSIQQPRTNNDGTSTDDSLEIEKRMRTLANIVIDRVIEDYKNKNLKFTK